MRVFILTTMFASVMFAGTATLQPVSGGKIEQVPANGFENVKKTFKTLKKVTDSKERAIVPDIAIDPANDEVFQYALDGGKTMLLVVNRGQRSFLGDTLINPTSPGYGKTLCAYMGTHFPDTTVPGGPQEPRVALDSVGGWFYFTRYPSSEIVILERNMSTKNPAFRFTINSGGILTIRRALIENLTTQSVNTTKPVPLNEWVYIQGRQQDLTHSVGWKTANDENVVSQRFTNAQVEVDILASAFMDVAFVSTYVDDSPIGPPCTSYEANVGVNCRTACLYNNALILPEEQGFYLKEFFWNPNSQMFVLMDNYNAAQKDISQRTNTFGFDIGLLNELIESYNTQCQDATLIYLNVDRRKANIDLYLDSETNPNIYGFDLRRLPAIPQ